MPPRRDTRTPLEKFHDAVAADDLDAVRRMLAEYADPEAREQLRRPFRGWTALHVAAAYNDGPTISEELLRAGFHADAPGPNRVTALQIAATGGSEALVRLLAGESRDPNAKNDLKRNALFYALINNRKDMLAALVEATRRKGAEPDLDPAAFDFNPNIRADYLSRPSEETAEYLAQLLGRPVRVTRSFASDPELEDIITACRMDSANSLNELLSDFKEQGIEGDELKEKLSANDDNGFPPLIHAIWCGVQTLPDPNQNNGRHPNHCRNLRNSSASESGNLKHWSTLYAMRTCG